VSRRPANDILETAGAFGRLGMFTCMMASSLNLPTAHTQRTSSVQWVAVARARGLLRAGGRMPRLEVSYKTGGRGGPPAPPEGPPAIWWPPFAGCAHPFCSGPAATGGAFHGADRNADGSDAARRGRGYPCANGEPPRRWTSSGIAGASGRLRMSSGMLGAWQANSAVRRRTTDGPRRPSCRTRTVRRAHSFAASRTARNATCHRTPGK